jgi:hypothetical protein
MVTSHTFTSSSPSTGGRAMARPFTWTPDREMALAWSVQGLPVPEQARRLDISVRTIEGWRRRCAFRLRLIDLTQTRSELYAEAWREALLAESERVRALKRKVEEARIRELRRGEGPSRKRAHCATRSLGLHILNHLTLLAITARLLRAVTRWWPAQHFVPFIPANWLAMAYWARCDCGGVVAA